MKPLFTLVLLLATARQLGPGGGPSGSLLTFEENRGQAGEGVDFFARGPAYTAWLAQGDVFLALGPGAGSPTVVSMKWTGGRAGPRARGLDPLPSRSHYLIGSDAAAWRRDVPHYGSVLYEDLYPGIDALFYGGRQGLEYDLMLEPGADPQQIRLAFDGVERLEVEAEGHLRLHAGTGMLRQLKPRV